MIPRRPELRSPQPVATTASSTATSASSRAVIPGSSNRSQTASPPRQPSVDRAAGLPYGSIPSGSRSWRCLLPPERRQGRKSAPPPRIADVYPHKRDHDYLDNENDESSRRAGNRPQDRRRDAKLQDVAADRNKWVLRGPAAPDHSDANDRQRESDHADQPTKVGQPLGGCSTVGRTQESSVGKGRP